MNTFKASVQYNDMKGSTAADRADKENAAKWLKDNDLISDEEFVVGVKMWAEENHGTHDDPIYVTFFVTDLNGHPDIPSLLAASGDVIEARRVRVDMNLVDFFGLFKRLEITLSNGGVLEGKSYPYE